MPKIDNEPLELSGPSTFNTPNQSGGPGNRGKGRMLDDEDDDEGYQPSDGKRKPVAKKPIGLSIMIPMPMTDLNVRRRCTVKNKPYANCNEATQRLRDEHVARSLTNWGCAMFTDVLPAIFSERYLNGPRTGAALSLLGSKHYPC